MNTVLELADSEVVHIKYLQEYKDEYSTGASRQRGSSYIVVYRSIKMNTVLDLVDSGVVHIQYLQENKD